MRFSGGGAPHYPRIRPERLHGTKPAVCQEASERAPGGNGGGAAPEAGPGGEAEAYYHRAIEEEPQNPAAFSELGGIYVGRKELQKAYAVVEQGARLHPRSAHMRAFLAGILLDMGERRRGQAVLEEAERLDPENEMVQAVREILETMKK